MHPMNSSPSASRLGNAVYSKTIRHSSFFVCLFLLLHATAVLPYARAAGIAISQDAAGRQLTVEWPGAVADGNGAFQVKIDDSASLRRPIVFRTIKARTIALNVLEAGLAPGTLYFLQIQPGDLRAQFRIRMQGGKVPLPSPDYSRRAWESAGRQWMHQYSGVKWDTPSQKWQLDPRWPHAQTNVGPQAYYLEHPARAAVNLALVDRDLKLMDELANFYLVYSQRFTTLGELRRKKSGLLSTALLDNQGEDSAKTLAWVEKLKSGPKSRVRESTLANSQFFHPVAALMRIITTLSDAERNPAMRSFVATYAPLVVEHHLIRLAFQANWNYWGEKNLPRKLVDIWRAILAASSPPRLSYQHGMFDRDLWLIATAAEILGANANDARSVSLTPAQLGQLRGIVQVGVRLFQSKRTLYSDTRNFQGRLVEGASYFNGDFDDHPTMAYAGYSGVSFPTPAQKRPAKGASWDISHFYRVPVFLRSLYDNRKATNLEFPKARDIQLVINQYMYRVFNGDFTKPLFSNFFDGSDGWYRVGYHGEGFGYPASQYCDSRVSGRPCLTIGGIQGWALLAFFNDDLAQLQSSLIKMAASNDPEIIRFRSRYYTYNSQTFAFNDASGKRQYPFLLFNVLSGLSERLSSVEGITAPIAVGN